MERSGELARVLAREEPGSLFRPRRHEKLVRGGLDRVEGALRHREGEDPRAVQLVAAMISKRGKRGKVGFAIRFHLGAGIEVGLSGDKRGAGLALPDGSYWQMRLGGDIADAELAIEDSLWVDGEGRPHATSQLVIEGLASRGGGRFPWLLKRMG